MEPVQKTEQQHVAKETSNDFQRSLMVFKEKINLFQWQLLDLNQIEIQWKELKTNMNRQGHQNLQDFRTVSMEEEIWVLKRFLHDQHSEQI